MFSFVTIKVKFKVRFIHNLCFLTIEFLLRLNIVFVTNKKRLIFVRICGFVRILSLLFNFVLPELHFFTTNF